MITALENWLENPDYDAGVALYKELGGDDPVLLTVFGLPETSFTMGKLEQALQELCPKGVKEEESKTKTQEHPPVVLKLIRERSGLHSALEGTSSMSDRHKMCKRILEIGHKLDGWYDHGQLPRGEAENELDEPDLPRNAWELHQLINTNMSYITKNGRREDKQGEVSRRKRMNVGIEERLKSMEYETEG